MDLQRYMPMVQALQAQRPNFPNFGGGRAQAAFNGQNWGANLQPGSDWRGAHPRIDQMLTGMGNPGLPGNGPRPPPYNTGIVPPHMQPGGGFGGGPAPMPPQGIAVGEYNPSMPVPSPGPRPAAPSLPAMPGNGLGLAPASNAAQGRPMGGAPAVPMIPRR